MRKTAWCALLLTIAWPGPGAGRARGQTLAIPVVPGEASEVVQRLGGQVHRLAEDIAADLGSSPAGPTLTQDARELAEAVREYRAALPTFADRYQARQAFAGLDASWHHLQAQVARSGVSTPVVARDMERVGEADERLLAILGMNASPPNYYTASAAPTGLADSRRLARALVDRAESLASLARADLVGGDGARTVQDAVNLAQLADNFHDGIDANAPIEAARERFGEVAAQGDRLGQDLANGPGSPRLQAAWQAYRAAEVLLRQNLGLANDPNALTGTAIPAEGPSPVVALADQLAGQVDTFLQAFAPRAGIVPEGGFFLADAQRLREAAEGFRQAVARRLDANQLAFAFRDVDALWQRLARRTNRIAQGRNGPVIQQVGQIGATCAQIHQLLGLPGYPPVLGPFPGPG